MGEVASTAYKAGKAMVGAVLERNKRTVQEDNILFDQQLPDVNTQSLPLLLDDINFGQRPAPADPAQLVTTVYSIFVILKLMAIGHPKSKPYYQQLCSSVYPDMDMVGCEARLMEKLTKLDHGEQVANEDEGSAVANNVQKLIDLFMDEMKRMVKGTPTGKRLTAAICSANYEGGEKLDKCLAGLVKMLGRLRVDFKKLDQAKLTSEGGQASSIEGNNDLLGDKANPEP